MTIGARLIGACVCISAALYGGVLVLSAQQPPQVQTRDGAAQAPAASGVIAGTLVASDSGRPVRRARVTLGGGTPRISLSVTTDDQGRFSFTKVPAGEFNLQASRPGYLDAIYGQKQPGSGRAGTPIVLRAGQQLDRLVMQIPKGGVITGVVLDEAGDPAFGTPVRAYRYVMRTGERTLESSGSGQADDRGVYRIPALPPGEYVVAAIPRDQADVEMKMMAEAKMVAAASAAAASRSADAQAQMAAEMKKVLDAINSGGDPASDPPTGYAPVYYPGTTQAASASTVTIGISEERPNVDVPLQLVSLARVHGTLVSTDGPLPPAAQVTLVDTGMSLPGLGSRAARVGPDGKFTFPGVAPGQYTVIARASSGQPIVKSPSDGSVVAKPMALAASQVLWAVADVVADGRNASFVTLTLQAGMSMTGRVVFDGASPPADLTRTRVALQPVGQSGPAVEMGSSVLPAPIDAEGRFSLAGIVPGRYRLTMASTTGLGGWSLRSSVIESRDTLDFPYEIKPNTNVTSAVMTFTNRPTLVSGMLQDSSGRPTSDYTIVVFAADNMYWTPQSRRIQATRPGTDGRFTFRDLPAGSYRMTAVADADPGQWFDPAFLRLVIGASMSMTLADGETKTQDVRVR
jgi:hypothetical protein